MFAPLFSSIMCAMQLRKLFDIQMKSKLILKDFLLVPYFVSHLICRWNEMGMMKSNLILKDFFLFPILCRICYVGGTRWACTISRQSWSTSSKLLVVKSYFILATQWVSTYTVTYFHYVRVNNRNVADIPHSLTDNSVSENGRIIFP